MAEFFVLNKNTQREAEFLRKKKTSFKKVICWYNFDGNCSEQQT